MDRTVRPQDDLFDYANGRWLRDVPIPPERSRYGVDSLMQDQALAQQRTLAEAARTSSDPEARKVGDFYSSFMDVAEIERRGTKPLDAELKLIAAAAGVRDLAPLMAHLDRIGVSVAMGAYVDTDAKHSDRYALWLSQDGLGLPDRDYYLDPKFADTSAKYRVHVATMLTLLGDRDARSEANAILALETALAKIEWAALDRRDPSKTYNPMTPSNLMRLAPDIDWAGYLQAEELPSPPPALIVREPDYFAHLSELIHKTPLSTWKAYLRYHLLSSAAPYLPKAFAAEDFAFSEGVLHGTQAAAPRWKRACELIDHLIGEASGKLYVAAYFPTRNKARADELVHNLLAAYRISIRNLDWMSAATKTEALAKLDKINLKVGYPEHWRDYSNLRIAPDDLLGNVFRAQAFEADRKRVQLAGPVDRSEWEMTAPTVDAYYDAASNQIGIAAGILQPPLFDPAADDAYNYGSTGASIGHEISHGFDNRGSQYDSNGNLRDWWTEEDHRKYKAKTDILVRQFDGFEPLPGIHINGDLVLPENIADLAGLEIAHEAYLTSLHGRTAPVIDGLTGDQRFFIGYAQSYMGKRRDALLVAQLKSNPHPPEKYRVNGLVVHMDSFYDAFKVHPGDGMYLPPASRVVLW